MDALASEATQGLRPGASAEELDRAVEEALSCPCVDDLKDGPCGKSFVAAFSCFIRSTADEKGTDCMEAFGAMQQCLLKHPEAFADFVRSKSESDAEHDAAGEAGGACSARAGHALHLLSASRLQSDQSVCQQIQRYSPDERETGGRGLIPGVTNALGFTEANRPAISQT
ncbi:hypothetical protein WJX81_003816 [Elliptochloris bilobata]|uniref:GCK domain-containing protein n=1 Tax=Elliptochloris bilobata TaxID=381761 RepID=A0AAW1QI35_9CHLO